MLLKIWKDRSYKEANFQQDFQHFQRNQSLHLWTVHKQNFRSQIAVEFLTTLLTVHQLNTGTSTGK